MANGDTHLPLERILRVRDNVGLQALTGTPVVLNLDTIELDELGGAITLAADVFTVVADQVSLDIEYTFTSRAVSGTAGSTARCRIQKDVGAGFINTSTKVHNAHHDVTVRDNAASIREIIHLVAGDKFRFHADRTRGTDPCESVPSGSFVTITRRSGKQVA